MASLAHTDSARVSCSHNSRLEKELEKDDEEVKTAVLKRLLEKSRNWKEKLLEEMTVEQLEEHIEKKKARTEADAAKTSGHHADSAAGADGSAGSAGATDQ